MSPGHNDPNRKPSPSTVSFIVAPSRSGRTYQYTLTSQAVRIGIAGLGLFLLLVIVGVVRLASVSVRANRVSHLEAMNDSLRNQFSRLELLERELDRMAGDNRRIRALAGLETPINANESGAGVANAPDGSGGFEALGDGAPWVSSAPTLTPHRGPISRGFQMEGTTPSQHAGVDIPGPIGAAIRAAGGGVITQAGLDDAFGLLVVIEHGNGLESLYGHNDELLVAEGDSVARGQQIAKLGSTGRSSAPHLHFEVRKDGVSVDPGELIRDYRGEQ